MEQLVQGSLYLDQGSGGGHLLLGDGHQRGQLGGSGRWPELVTGGWPCLGQARDEFSESIKW